MLRRLILALPLAATLVVASCGHDTAQSAPSADNDATVAAPATTTPATSAAPAQPDPKNPGVQPTKPTPGTPPAPPSPSAGPMDVELSAYQVIGLADAAPGAAPADAQAAQSIIVLVARGKHRSGGWTSELVQLPTRIFPPQFELRATPPPPDVMSMQMITPFTAAAWFRMDQPVASLKVRVGAELRDVKVEPAKKVAEGMPGR
jgi:hypothetical protein